MFAATSGSSYDLVNSILQSYTTALAGSLPQLLGVLLGLVLVLLVLLLWRNQRIKTLQRQNRIMEKILAAVDVQGDSSKQFASLLDIIIEMIGADNYFVYILDKENESYALRVTRYRTTDRGVVGVSYSGLAPYEKEKYNPPVSIREKFSDGEPVLIKDGEVPLLQMVVSGGRCLIRIGPVKKVTAENLRSLAAFGRNIQRIVDVFLTLEKLSTEVEVISTTGKAITELSKSAFKVENLGHRIMAISAQFVGASGCFFAIQGERGEWQVPVITKLNNELDNRLKHDSKGLEILHEALGKQQHLRVNQESQEFYCIPDYLIAAGVKELLLVRPRGFEGVAVFYYHKPHPVENYMITVVIMLTQRLSELWESQTTLGRLSDSYIRMLQVLVESTDNMAPSTVGHSELIANYATAIGMELNLTSTEVENIRLAAYFHDVGMLGLSSDILNKEGKFNEIEYEAMKLHTIIGASVIESTTTRDEAALYIRHHHERWDGFGYPDKLKQQEIPLGSRIIAVADMLNAKLQGRQYREPVSYERAVLDLQAASGTQLDPLLVQTLLSWLNKKRAAADPGRSLGPCWEMKCSPAHICQLCPAYKVWDRNCWEHPTNNCAAHGSRCETCMVKTEARSRSAF